ncbi:uncharacterized protein ARMOST_02749 [Armillaria ostoyae]|uniref:Uncharacterized protein n=1 Tax=Armillaria ostoyae TaxID=47428 RepID=A0A284QSI5_ARMOS|nr:uncharacterized protein ARMOST_02749 [Armillaria ostoyae]
MDSMDTLTISEWIQDYLWLQYCQALLVSNLLARHRVKTIKFYAKSDTQELGPNTAEYTHVTDPNQSEK